MLGLVGDRLGTSPPPPKKKKEKGGALGVSFVCVFMGSEQHGAVFFFFWEC